MAEKSQKPQKPLPTIDADSMPFWRAASEHYLALPRCRDCGAHHFPPRALCPKCHGGGIAWVRASGRGTIYSFTISRRGAGAAFKDDAPYAIALIDLEEGPRMMSNVLADDLEAIRIGAAVEVVFERASEEIAFPKFKLSEG